MQLIGHQAARNDIQRMQASRDELSWWLRRDTRHTGGMSRSRKQSVFEAVDPPRF